MSPRSVAQAAALLVLAACDRGSTPPERFEPPFAPNVLLVSLDTTRADHLSCYGYGRATSPRIDALAARGHRFDAAFAPMATTLPSHASMFTSLEPRQLGALSNAAIVPPQARTLAERLKERGYATAAFVGALPLHAACGLEQGFDVYDAPSGDQRVATESRERAAAWLRQRSDQPFFCFVHFYDPHGWYQPPADLAELFAVPPGLHPAATDFVEDPAALTPALREAARAAYDAEIRYVDRELGLLLEELERAGSRSRTVVVVIADHGETLDELVDSRRYAFDHGEFLSRRELRIPLVLELPEPFARSAPAVHRDVVSTLDLMPTLLELCGAPIEPPALGRSLVPLLRGGALEPRPAFAQRRALTPTEQRDAKSPLLAGDELSVITDRWHYVHCRGRPRELFDLHADPLELVNVAAENADVARKLRALLDGWRSADPGPLAANASEVRDQKLLDGLRALGYAVDGDAAR